MHGSPSVKTNLLDVLPAPDAVQACAHWMYAYMHIEQVMQGADYRAGIFLTRCALDVMFTLHPMNHSQTYLLLVEAQQPLLRFRPEACAPLRVAPRSMTLLTR